MDSFQFENIYFDINNCLKKTNSLENLDVMSEYMNFALHATLLKQATDYNIELQKKLSRELLLDYLKEEKVTYFTRMYNIRDNMKKIGKDNILMILIKNIIEKNCYDRNANKISIENMDLKISNHIVNEISNGNYQKIMEFIKSDSKLLSILISEYVKFNYGMDETNKNRLKILCNNDTLATFALNQLSIDIKNKSSKTV